MNITLHEAKRVLDNIGATHVVIWAVTPDGAQHCATFGKTSGNALEAAKAGNKLKAALGWPDDLCKALPLERVCKHCDFYKPDYGIFCFNGWSGDGSSGHCMLEPKPLPKKATEQVCRYWAPKP